MTNHPKLTSDPAEAKDLLAVFVAGIPDLTGLAGQLAGEVNRATGFDAAHSLINAFAERQGQRVLYQLREGQSLTGAEIDQLRAEAWFMSMEVPVVQGYAIDLARAIERGAGSK